MARAKKWDEGKQLAIILTLLHGKLVDTYVELPEESKGSVNNLRKALVEHAICDSSSVVCFLLVRTSQDVGGIAEGQTWYQEGGCQGSN